MTPVRRLQLRTGQNPFAVVFSCSDSRVPAEIIFDQGLGDLFVVRTAGEVIDSSVIGSIEFAIADLGVSLVVVLGHEKCGAIAATISALSHGDIPPGYIRDLVQQIAPSGMAIRSRGESVELDPAEMCAEHSWQTVRLLTERSRIIDDAIGAGRLGMVGATYHLGDGLVHPHGTAGPVRAS